MLFVIAEVEVIYRVEADCSNLICQLSSLGCVVMGELAVTHVLR